MSAAAENNIGERPSLVKKFANKYSIDPTILLTTLKSTCFRQAEGEVSNEQMVALLVVADSYGLNPFTKEIYAYPDKYKGIVPVVSIDGWVRIVTEHPDYNGYDVILPDTMIAPAKEGEHPLCWAWITIKMHRKKVEHTPALTEYFDECYKPPYKPRGKDYFIDSPWQTHPKRFLRHKAFIQAGRVVFGFAGIYDDDEAQRIVEAGGRADSSVVSTQGSRTEQAKEKLKQALTDKSGEHNPLSDLAVNRQTGEIVRTNRIDMPLTGHGSFEPPDRELADQERLADSRQTPEEAVKAAMKGDFEGTTATFKYDIPKALAELRKQNTVVGLKKLYQEIGDDFDFSGRDLPIDVEAQFRDILEDLQGTGP